MKKVIDIVAPSGPFPAEILPKIKEFLKGLGFEARIPEDILGPDLLCANSDAKRFEFLKQALYAEDSEVIWCVRGGYGAGRLLPALNKLIPPKHKKVLIGFSDITALHLFFTQQWGWETTHGPSIRQLVERDINEVSVEKAIQFLQTGTASLQQTLMPLNKAAQNANLTGVLSGGNLKVTETSLATFWELNSQDKILMLEDVSEEAYRVDRILLHLYQADLVGRAKAVIFGDFSYADSKEEIRILGVLKRFAEATNIPVFYAPFFGHGKENILWKYASAQIKAGVLSQ